MTKAPTANLIAERLPISPIPSAQDCCGAPWSKQGTQGTDRQIGNLRLSGYPLLPRGKDLPSSGFPGAVGYEEPLESLVVGR
jgi:hypothetical protein